MAIKRQKLIHLHGTKQLTNTGVLALGEIAVRHAETKVDTELAVETKITKDGVEENVLVYFPSLEKVESTVEAAIKTLGDGKIANIQGQIDDIVESVGVKEGEGAPTGLYKEVADAEAAAKRYTDSVVGELPTKTEGDETRKMTVAEAITAAEAAAKAEAEAVADAIDKVLGGDFSEDATVADAIDAAAQAAANAAGAAAQALVDAKGYTDTLIGGALGGESEPKTVKGYVDAAEKRATDYADGLASNYDAAGSAAKALVDAKGYTDEVLGGTFTKEATVADAIAAVLGTTGDTADANTVYGAKKYAEAAANAAEAAAKAEVEAVLGTTGDTADKNTVYGVKAYVDEVKSLVTASTQFLGVADHEIKVDGEDKTGATIKVDGKDVTAGAGDIVLCGTSEFIWDGAKWVLLGDTTAEMAAISELKTAVNTTIPNAIKAEGNAAKADAKAYTDGRIGNLGTVGEGDDATAQTVKGYVDAEISKVVGENGSLSEAIETAKDYTDERIGNLGTVGEGDAATEQTVKGYVDAEIKVVEDAVAELKDYTDDKIAEVNGVIEENERVVAESLTNLDGRVATLEAIDHDAYVAADTALKTELQKEIAEATLTSAEVLLSNGEAITGTITEPANGGTALTFDFTGLVIDCGTYDE